MTARYDYKPNLKKLTKLKEGVIVKHILNLDSRGFLPILPTIREMANRLLTERDAGQVGIKWLENFIKRTPLIKTYISRPYNYK